MIGFALCGSFCTHASALSALKQFVEIGEDVLPILSNIAANTDTRFGTAKSLEAKLTHLCHRSPIKTIPDAEPLGPAIPLEALIIAPCTGNTLAKLSQGITDTPVCMAAKAHLRCDRPLLIALASNDALSANLKNIALLLNRKNVYFVPMCQDSPADKPHSLVADFTLIPSALKAAREGQQMRPLFR